MVQWDGWHLGNAGMQVQSPAQWVKDLVLPLLWLKSQLWLRSDPGLGTPYAAGLPKTNKQTNKRKTESIWLNLGFR